jgi:hypothetical protein
VAVIAGHLFVRVGLGNAERGAGLRQSVGHVAIEPCRMAELERHPALRQQDSEKRLQPVDILLEVGRQLEQDRPRLFAQRGEIIEQIRDMFAGVLEAGKKG